MAGEGINDKLCCNFGRAGISTLKAETINIPLVWDILLEICRFSCVYKMKQRISFGCLNEI